MWFEVTLWSLVGGHLTIPKRSKKDLPGCSFHVDLHHFVKLTLPGKRESNLPCLFNGRKKSQDFRNPHLQVRKVEVRCCICAPAKLGDKIPAKGTWNWNHHGIWRGGICWTSLIWENGGEIQPKKNIDVQTKFGFSEKIVHLLWEEGLLDPWKKLPTFSEFFGVNPSVRPCMCGPFQRIQLPGLFNDPRMAGFFFDRKKITRCCAL